MKPVRILVTGGAGFIGSHTVDLLLAQEREVVVLDNLSSGKLENLNLKHPNLELIEGDVLEYPLIADLIKNCDAVLHLAAIASVPKSIIQPIYTTQVNVQGLLHVLQAITEVKPSVRLVYASSSAIYGQPSQLPCREDRAFDYQPLSPYALQKQQDEQWANLYAPLHQISSLGLRYFNVYGERQDPSSPYSGVISLFIDAYQKDQEATVFGDGTQTRDFIYVGDVARANWLALQSSVTGMLNIATGRPQTILELIQCIEATGNHPLKKRFAAPRSGDIYASYANVEKAKQVLDFQSQIPLDEGIQRLNCHPRVGGDPSE